MRSPRGYDQADFFQANNIDAAEWDAFWGDAMITEFEPDAGVVPRPNQPGERVRTTDRTLGTTALRFYAAEI